MRGASLALLVSFGCARAGSATGDDAGIAPRADAGVDAPLDPRSDAAPPPPPPPSDACIPVVTQLLVNPQLDLAPQGAGWTEQRIRSAYPLITDQDSPIAPTAHTAPYRAWLGGFTGSNVTDVLSQDIAIPPATTRLVIAGFYAVRTDERTASARDTAPASLTQIGGATIAEILSLSNLTDQTSWTPFEFTVAQDLSGQTVRLRFSSTNDGAYPTSFFFDTLGLTATHGCP